MMATYYGDTNSANYNDYMGPYTGPNTLYGGAGNDTIEGYTDADRLDGESGDDLLFGWFGNDTMFGGTGNDELWGEDNNDIISGGDGNDSLVGGNNNDTLNGNAGNDVLYGDYYSSETGQDILSGGAGSDTMYGGVNNDTYIYNFNADGFDFVYDAAGDYDTLRVNGVSNISQIEVHRGSVIGESDNHVIIYTDADAADSVLSEYVLVANYFNGSSYAEGRIEYLNVNGTQYWFSDYIV